MRSHNNKQKHSYPHNTCCCNTGDVKFRKTTIEMFGAHVPSQYFIAHRSTATRGTVWPYSSVWYKSASQISPRYDGVSCMGTHRYTIVIVRHGGKFISIQQRWNFNLEKSNIILSISMDRFCRKTVTII